MKPKKYQYLLLLLLLSTWTANWPSLASSARASPCAGQTEVFPIARVYRQQIDDQIASPPLTVASPCRVILGLHPSQTFWLEDERLAGLNPPDPLSTQMSLQL